MAKQQQASNDSNLPVHTVRHRNIKAAIWVNQTDKGPMYNVTVSRSYRDDSGEWHDKQSFGYDDLMNVSALMYEAHAFISADRAKPADSARANSRPAASTPATSRR